MRIAALYRVEMGIRGRDPQDGRGVRQMQSGMLVEELRDWLDAQAVRVPTRGPRPRQSAML